MNLLMAAPSDISLYGFEMNQKNFHFYTKSCSGNYLACNLAQAQTAGFERIEDMIGSTDFDLVHSEYAPSLQANDKEVMVTQNSKIIVEHCISANGQQFTALSHKVPLFSRMKKVIGLMGLSIVMDEKTKSVTSITDTPKLTARQTNCVFYLIKGMTIKKIAITLNLSPKTVEHYLEQIKIKLDCHSRTELITKCLKIPSIRNRILEI